MTRPPRGAGMLKGEAMGATLWAQLERSLDDF